MKTSLFAFCAIALSLVSSNALAERKNFSATLTGAAEVPPVDTPGTGQAKLTFDTTTKKLCGSITYQNLSSAVQAARLHVGAIGDDGGVGNPAYVTLSVGAGSPIVVDETLDTDQETSLLAPDNTYVNVTTANHADGEIRGELTEDLYLDDQCPEGDAGTGDGGSDGGNTSSSGGSSGATTVRADGGNAPSSQSTTTSSCATTPGGSSSPLAFAAAAGVAIALASRKRRKG